MRFRLLFFWLFCQFHSKAQDSSRTELTIIGTVHEGNRFLNHRTLYRKIISLNPDYVFIEQSDPFRKIFGLATGSWLGVFSVSVEQLAEQKLNRRKKHIPLLPYDTAFNRRAYLAEMTQNEKRIFELIDDAFLKGEMDAVDSLSYKYYTDLHHDVFSRFDSSLEVINQPFMVENSKKLMEFEETVLLDIAKRYVRDTSLVSWYAYDKFFWIRRNQYMVQQILNQIRKEPGKKYVVLAGFLHRYFLEDGLRPYLRN